MRRTLLNLLSVTLFLTGAEGLYEYICQEALLFVPYVRVYNGRRGELIWDKGPGLHIISKLPQKKDLYVCINGPAYLYFEKTTKLHLGQVYEAPQFHVFAHTCEMHNVLPHWNATEVDFILKLTAVYLYGDKMDYRKPSITTFTAPYFFDKDVYEPDFIKHFQNATSVAVIGRMTCTLTKGDMDPKIPIKFRSDVPPRDPAIPPGQDLRNGKRPEYDEYLCRVGFSDQLTGVIQDPTNSTKRKSMQALVNDELIMERGCGPTIFDLLRFEAFEDEFRDLSAKADAEWIAAGEEVKLKDDFKIAVEAALKKYEDEIAAIEKRIVDDKSLTEKMKAKLRKRIEKIKKEIIEPENAKLASYQGRVDETKLAVDANKAPPFDVTTAKATAIADLAALEAAMQVLANATTPADIIAAKIALYPVERKAWESAEDAERAISAYDMFSGRAAVLVAEVLQKLAQYSLGSGPHSQTISYKNRTEPVEFFIPAAASVGNLGCEIIPRRNGEFGECTKGKADANSSCDLFQVSLGLFHPWKQDPLDRNSPDRIDKWKSEILDLTGDVFTKACPYLPNRRKFVTLIKRLLGYYLTSDAHYYQEPSLGTSMSCKGFKNWQEDPEQKAIPKPHPGQTIPGTNGTNVTIPPNPPDPRNREERQDWAIIRKTLAECLQANRTLVFVDKANTYGQWQWAWVKPGRPRVETVIVPYQEQADKEYVFNWVVDMSWRIFATALGICMPGYEKENPFITAMYYSFFTEDFLIPLRNTWINPRDNLVFQWILGEFYNGDAEGWAMQCMEASFLYAAREDYRPPRNLRVNCDSEHNYFITGKFAGQGGLATKMEMKAYLQRANT